MWLTLNPNASGKSACSRAMSVDFPLPDGPHRIRGRTGGGRPLSGHAVVNPRLIWRSRDGESPGTPPLPPAPTPIAADRSRSVRAAVGVDVMAA